MVRSTLKLVFLTVLVVAGATGLYFYDSRATEKRQIARLESEKKHLQQVVERLNTDRRVAEVLVTDQKTVAGVLHTTLLFVEYDRAGKPLPAKSFIIKGRTAHIDALVIKFDGKFVEQRDPLRGQSVALFYRLFGEHENPAEAQRIDRPGEVPDVYRLDLNPPDTRTPDADEMTPAHPEWAESIEFERALWANFWRLIDDAEYRQQMGVRVAQGESPWGPFEPDRLYTVTIDSDGGLNLASEKLKGIYSEALRRRTETH